MNTINNLLEHKINLFIFLVFFATLSAIIFQTHLFSPDSWAYYELSKTIFSDSFYEHNTIRSYLGYKKSSSFPFGYPIILSILNTAFINTPMNAVFLNIFVTVLSAIMLYKISLCFRLNEFYSSLVIMVFLFFPPYLYEIYSGRSMPLAMFFYIFGIFVYLKYKFYLFSAIIISLSAVVRFDYLIFSLLTILILFLYSKEKIYIKSFLFLGLLIGLSPWIWFSIKHFNTFWMSDNSWVAKSALNNYVLDFPAVSNQNINNEPLLWLYKIVKNIPRLIYSLIATAIKNQVVFISSFLVFLICFIKHQIRLSKMDLILILYVVISLAPYLTTGYFDSRYFSIHFLILSIFLFLKLSSCENKYFKFILLVAVLCNTFLASKFYISNYYGIYKNKEVEHANSYLINKLQSEHIKEKDTTYIFFTNNNLVARYGAITGFKAAMPPSNYGKMTNKEKESYFNSIGNYKKIYLESEK